jgi:agmatine/peptidylarginine deiminase
MKYLFMKTLLPALFAAIFAFAGLSLQAQEKTYTHHMSEAEAAKAYLIGKDFVETDPPVGEVRAVAEFEPMESVLIRYQYGLDIPISMVASLAEEIHVTTLVSNSYQENAAVNDYTAAGVNMENISFIYAPTNTQWSRDYGPWYIEYGEHQIGIVDFPYNRPRPDDDDVPVEVAAALGLELFGMNLIHTGGNWMADGVSSAASTTLVVTENSYTVPEIDSLVEAYLGIETYHLNDDPLDDYIEHIDCWGKFLDVDKILLGQVPESDYRYDDYEAIADYYANSLSGWGTPYEVYRVFTPGGNPATPYTNSLILNNRVFVPMTGSQWDDEAIASYQEAMPGYEIIGISYNYWYDTDALHCRTHEMADQGMLKIKHYPVLGETGVQDTYQITAEIIPFSGAALYPDSLKVYYKYSETNNYQFAVMEHLYDETYQAAIPAPGGTNEIYYYIHAADASGRSENHPYIGAPDPHDFYPDASLAAASLQVNVDTLYAEVMVDLAQSSTLTIGNSGNLEMGFSIEVEYKNQAGWLQINPQTDTVEAGGSTEVDVVFNAVGMETGIYEASLFLEVTNDPDTRKVRIPVKMKVVINTPVHIVQTNAIRAYPNPFRDFVKIEGFESLGGDAVIRIYDLRGEKLHSWSAAEWQGKTLLRWDAREAGRNQIPDRVYLLEVINGNNRMVKKLSKISQY